MKAYLLIIVALIASGCASISTVPSGSPALILSTQQTRYYHYFGGRFKITFPEGRYEPSFQSAAGIYYAAPRPLLMQALGSGPKSGGVFIPRSQTHHGHYFWLQEENPTQIIPLDEPLDFTYAR